MGDTARLLAGSRCGTDILAILQRLNRPVVEVRGDHHRPAAGPATEDGDRFTLGGIKIVALLAAELTEGDRDAHTL